MIPPISSLRVDEVDAPEAALAEHDRALHPGRPGADDEHVAVAVLRRLEALGVPAAAELLARGRVLRAADVAAGIRLRDADVAADALADLVEPPLLDLAREERVGDRRPRGADHVPGAAARRSPPSGPGRSAARRRRSASPSPRARAPVHSSCQPCLKKREAPESFDHSVAEPMATSQRSTRWSARRTNSRPSSRSTPYGLSAATEIRVATVHSPSDGLPRQLEELQPEARAVLERAAVLVGAPVVERREELHGQVAVRPVDVDDVEAGLAGPPGRGRPVLLDAADVVALHRLRRHEQVVARELRGRRSRAAATRGAGSGRPSGAARRRPARRARAPRRT